MPRIACESLICNRQEKSLSDAVGCHGRASWMWPGFEGRPRSRVEPLLNLLCVPTPCSDSMLRPRSRKIACILACRSSAGLQNGMRDAVYPAAMALVGRTGSFKALQRALRLESRGRVLPVSQKYMHGPVTPTRSASCATDRPRLIQASRIRPQDRQTQAASFQDHGPDLDRGTQLRMVGTVSSAQQRL